MRANLTLDCIRSTESTATGLLDQIRQSRINIRCSSTYVRLNTPWPKWLLEGMKGFKTLVCLSLLVLFFLFPKKQSDTYSIKALFKVWCVHVSSARTEFQLGLMHFIIDKHVCVSFMVHACCFGKLVTNYCYQTTDGSFSFSISPDHEAVFLARPSQGRAFNCFFAGGSSWQCLTSFLPWKKGKKKKGEILETAAKRISAYAWSPLWSLSNKRRSFNLVTTGAFHYTLHAEILARKVSAPPNVPDESSDLAKFMNMTVNIL